MALKSRLSNLEANVAAAAAAALFNNGFLRIFGADQPVSADAPIGSQPLLVELRFGPSAFGAAVNGVVSANTIISGTAVASGKATWFRAFTSDGATAIRDGSVGTTGCDLNLERTGIQAGGLVSVSSGTFTQPKS